MDINTNIITNVYYKFQEKNDTLDMAYYNEKGEMKLTSGSGYYNIDTSKKPKFNKDKQTCDVLGHILKKSKYDSMYWEPVYSITDICECDKIVKKKYYMKKCDRLNNLDLYFEKNCSKVNKDKLYFKQTIDCVLFYKRNNTLANVISRVSKKYNSANSTIRGSIDRTKNKTECYNMTTHEYIKYLYDISVHK